MPDLGIRRLIGGVGYFLAVGVLLGAADGRLEHRPGRVGPYRALTLENGGLLPVVLGLLAIAGLCLWFAHRPLNMRAWWGLALLAFGAAMQCLFWPQGGLRAQVAALAITTLVSIGPIAAFRREWLARPWPGGLLFGGLFVLVSCLAFTG